jgi:hypothetical protein
VTERFYWKARLVKSGPWVPVVVWYGAPVIDGEEQDRSWSFQCLVRTETTSRLVLQGDHCPVEIDGLMLRNITRSDQGEYEFLRDHAQWATAHAPHMHDAAPAVPIDKKAEREAALRAKSVF